MAPKPAFTHELPAELNLDEPRKETVLFSLDGVEYEVELTPEKAEELRTRLRPFIQASLKGAAKRRLRHGR